jgi:hypothetical protein
MFGEKTLLKIIILFLIAILVSFITFWFIRNSKEDRIVLKSGLSMNMKIKSRAFENNSYIPPKYTCDGENINPSLEISGVPEKVQSLVLIVDDPDAPRGTFLHWLVWNISPDISFVAENSLPSGAVQGVNDFGREDYGGPCPPSGTHRYFFKIYALDKKLSLAKGAGLSEVEREIQNHILDKAELIGLYRRK